MPISAALYLALTICTRLTDTTHLLPLGERWIVGIFVTQDVITIVVQALGSGLAGIAMSKNANGEDFFISADTSNNILLAGLVVQVSRHATAERNEALTGPICSALPLHVSSSSSSSS